MFDWHPWLLSHSHYVDSTLLCSPVHSDRTHTLLPAHFLYFHLCLSREESGPPDWQADPLLPFVTCTHCKPPTLASQVLGLQARATLLSCMVSFLSFATVYTGFLLVDYQWGKIGVIQKESSPYPFAIDFPGLLKLFSVLINKFFQTQRYTPP